MDLVTLAVTTASTSPDRTRDTPRIPALASDLNGNVIAAWDVREDWRDLPGPFDIMTRRSTDGGLTWQPPQPLRRHTQERGFGDASLICDPATGDLWCWYVASTGRSFFDAEPGPEGDGLELWLATSVDQGQTWQHREMTAELKPEGIAGMFAASGNGIVLTSPVHQGRLVQSFVMRTTSGQHYAATATSDDHGRTWQLNASIGPDCDENKVVELANGDVLMHARATPHRRSALSYDGGQGFSSPRPDSQLTDPGCNGGLARVGEHVICSLLDDPRFRRKLTLRSQSDGSDQWTSAVTIDPGACAYSVLVPLGDDAVGLCWERGNYAEITFARIGLDELGLDGTDVSLEPVPPIEGVANEPVVGTGSKEPASRAGLIAGS